MAYISTERVAEIRKQINAEFPDFKFRCYREHSSTVCVVIVSAPMQLLTHEDQQRGYIQVNEYTIANHYKGEAKEALTRLYAIMNEGQKWHETGDYGNQPSFYTYVYIGEFGKPFIQTKATIPGNPLPIAIEGTMAKIVHNESKDGVEIYFPSKPNASILDNIKANGFRWGKFNKCWYARVSSRSLETAAKYGSLPSTLNPETVAADEEAEATSSYINAQELAFESRGSDNGWSR